MKKHLKRTAVLLLLGLVLFQPSARAVLREPYPAQPRAEVWNMYDPGLRYFYQQLTEAEKRVFSARYDTIALGEAALWSERIGSLSEKSRARVNYVLLNDCPELMFYSLTYDRGYEAIQLPDEEYLAAHPEEMERKNAACARILDRIREEADGDTDYDLEMAVIDYMIRHCRYTMEDFFADPVPDEGIRTAYSALAEGEATCSGYAAGFLYAMRYYGIPCASLSGLYYDGSGYGWGHQWNAVQIDGTWAHVDVTWNDMDSEGFLDGFYPYVNLTTLEIRKTHWVEADRARLDFGSPRCTSGEENYYVKEGLVLGENWEEEFSDLVLEARAGGRDGFGIRARNDELYREITEYLEGMGLLAWLGMGLPLRTEWIAFDDLRLVYCTWGAYSLLTEFPEWFRRYGG